MLYLLVAMAVQATLGDNRASTQPAAAVMRVALDRLRSEACEGRPKCLVVVGLTPLRTDFNCHNLEDSSTAVLEAFRNARDMTPQSRLPVARADGVRFDVQENVEVMCAATIRFAASTTTRSAA